MHSTFQVGNNLQRTSRLKPGTQALSHNKIAEHPAEFVNQLIDEHPVCLFSHSGSPRSAHIKRVLTGMEAKFEVVDTDLRGDTERIEEVVHQKCDMNIPVVFIGSMPFGPDAIESAERDNTLEQIVRNAGGLA